MLSGRITEARRRVLLDASAITRLRRSLMTWYRHHARELPWRVPPPAAGRRAARPDPYSVMVSEAMLQQTQVATVVSYFERFIARFPTPGELASASEQEVLKLWEGLGYYRRARLLHAAARAIVEQYGGTFPNQLKEISALPGVGVYTAGAIASIAFGRPVAAVDGNVIRVISRMLALESPPDDAGVIKRCRETAAQWVSRQNPGDFNQAMMELGATVCRPRRPDCPQCPLRAMCLGRASGRAEQLGVGGRPAPVRPVVHRVYVIERPVAGGGVAWLIQQRATGGLWAGMWEFVTIEGEAGDDTNTSSVNIDADAKRSSARGSSRKGRPARANDRCGEPDEISAKLVELLDGAGLSAAMLGRLTSCPLTTFEHRTTHRRICFEAHRIRLTGAGPRLGKAGKTIQSGLGDPNVEAIDGRLRWATGAEIGRLPLSNPQRRILALLETDDVT